MEKKTQKMSLWLLIVFISFSVPLSDNEFYFYFIAGFLIILGLFSNRLSIPINKNSSSMYPFYLIAIWLFGVIVGAVKQNPSEFIVRNFAGTVCYLLFYAIPQDIREDGKKLTEILIKSSVIASAYVCIASLLYTRTGGAFWPFSNAEFNHFTQSVMSSAGLMAFVLEAVSIRTIFTPNPLRKKIAGVIFFGLSLYASVIANNMGGYLLAFIMIMWLSGMSCFNRLFTSRRILFLIFLFVFSLFLMAYDYYSEGFLYEIFSLADHGNAKRMYQIGVVLERFSLLGNGIGAPFNYTFTTKSFYTYSIEVSYFNCIDKYGILSIPLFYIMFRSVYLPIRNIFWKQGDPIQNLVALGLMAYAFIAIGNPILFAAYNVIAHCLSLTLSDSSRPVETTDKETAA